MKQKPWSVEALPGFVDLTRVCWNWAYTAVQFLPHQPDITRHPGHGSGITGHVCEEIANEPLVVFGAVLEAEGTGEPLHCFAVQVAGQEKHHDFVR